jgi:hypothetical protein
MRRAEAIRYTTGYTGLLQAMPGERRREARGGDGGVKQIPWCAIERVQQ